MSTICKLDKKVRELRFARVAALRLYAASATDKGEAGFESLRAAMTIKRLRKDPRFSGDRKQVLVMKACARAEFFRAEAAKDTDAAA